MSLSKALDEVCPQIDGMIKKCKNKPKGIVQPTIDAIVELSLQKKVAYRIQVFAKNVGIHPANREGTGVDPFNGQSLTVKISHRGFSIPRLENPMLFEKGINEIGRLQDQFVKTSFEESNGYLKTIEAHEAWYLPVTCSHTFAATNLAQGGTLGLDPDICGDDGLIDQAKVLALCPS